MEYYAFFYLSDFTWNIDFSETSTNFKQTDFENTNIPSRLISRKNLSGRKILEFPHSLESSIQSLCNTYKWVYFPVKLGKVLIIVRKVLGSFFPVTLFMVYLCKSWQKCSWFGVCSFLHGWAKEGVTSVICIFLPHSKVIVWSILKKGTLFPDYRVTQFKICSFLMTITLKLCIFDPMLVK